MLRQPADILLLRALIGLSQIAALGRNVSSVLKATAMVALRQGSNQSRHLKIPLSNLS